MKSALVWVPLAFVAGGMIGFLGPNGELQALKARREAPAERRGAAKGEAAFGSFSELVNIPARAHRRRERPAATPPAASTGAATNAAPRVEAAQKAAPSKKERPRNPADLRLRLEEASELWRTRAEMAKAKAFEKLELDAEGEARFNAAVDAMNDRLRESMGTIAELLANEEKMTPELGFRLMGDVSTTLAEGYDALGEVATGDHRADVSNLQMIDFIDPMVAEPLIAVQDKLEPPVASPEDGNP